MSTLTILGLFLDIVGAIILLGPEYHPIKKVVKRIDPFYRTIQLGMDTLYREGTEIEDGTMTTAGEMRADRWEFTVARWFLNRRIEGRIDKDNTLTLAGVGIRRNEQEIPLPKEHTGSIRSSVLVTCVVSDWLEDSQERRMYRMGGSLLVFGFTLQLLAQFTNL